LTFVLSLPSEITRFTTTARWRGTNSKTPRPFRILDCSIPGSRRLERLDENIGSLAVELTPDDLREIETAASKITVQGAGYPEHLERMTYR
jgi:hypothetical protein